MSKRLDYSKVRTEIMEFVHMTTNVVKFAWQSKLFEKHWSEDFQLKEIKEVFAKLEVESLKLPNINEMNREELEVLGFGIWGETQFIVPSYLHKLAIRDGVMTPETDTDTRFGCFFAFVTPKE